MAKFSILPALRALSGAQPDTVNLAGGRAYSVSPRLELVSLLVSTSLGDDFYRTEAQTVARLRELGLAGANFRGDLSAVEDVQVDGEAREPAFAAMIEFVAVIVLVTGECVHGRASRAAHRRSLEEPESGRHAAGDRRRRTRRVLQGRHRAHDRRVLQGQRRVPGL